jgi:hypothetical protein
LFILFFAGMLSQFAPLPALAADDAASCAANSEARQLDYWLGEWAVASPGMAGKGHSNVHLSLDQCAIVESWGSDTSDHRGENTIAYNSEDKAWYSLFVDNHGRGTCHERHGDAGGRGVRGSGARWKWQGDSEKSEGRAAQYGCGRADLGEVGGQRHFMENRFQDGIRAQKDVGTVLVLHPCARKTHKDGAPGSRLAPAVRQLPACRSL